VNRLRVLTKESSNVCHDDDSRPPGPPNPGEVASAGPIELTAADGNQFAAYQAVPATPNGRNIVVLPDIRGLHPFYPAVAERFAEAGFHAVALDYFGRTAGIGDRSDEFDFQQHLPSVSPDTVLADTTAAVSAVNGLNAGPTFTIGFCFGGSQSWRLTSTDLDIRGAIGLYGKPRMVNDVLHRMTKPLLLLVAGADKATPLAEFEALDAELTELGKDHETHVYEGAPHSFFDRGFAEWADACADVWRRVLAFTEKYG
jgi:carboxymethylenebutenolidase